MMGKRILGISIPCFNEEENIIPLCEKIITICDAELEDYKCIIQFIDNCSEDKTQECLKYLVNKYPGKVRAIFNAENYVWRSGGHGLLEAEGDCVISMAADFEDPPALIPELVEKWEKGAKIVACVKSSSNENKIMAFFRNIYYRILNGMSDQPFINNFYGFGLYDREFIELYRELLDECTVFRTFVSQYGWNIDYVFFRKESRKYGKSKHTVFSLLDDFFKTLTSSSYICIRITTLIGFFVAAISFILGVAYIVVKMAKWDQLTYGMAPIIISMFFLGGIQLFVLGVIGEYIIKLDLRMTPYKEVHERMR